jgi:hypothetical protein
LSFESKLTCNGRTDKGFSIDFRYKGVIQLAEEVSLIFDMDEKMHTVPFGYASMWMQHPVYMQISLLTCCAAGSHTFFVADPDLKVLENSTFVSNGRILVHENGLTVETRQSLVVAAKVMD